MAEIATRKAETVVAVVEVNREVEVAALAKKWIKEVDPMTIE